MKSINKIVIAIVAMLCFTVSEAQIKNTKTETVKVYGNCGMCKSNIEKAGNIKKESKLSWDQATSMATLTYDSKKTNGNEILKRIALMGYDSDAFRAPDAMYSNLHGCCQYERPVSTTAVATTVNATESSVFATENAVEDQLKAFFDSYFSVKDALVVTDGIFASAQAKKMLTAISGVKMSKLNSQEHAVWMKVMSQLKEDTEHIANTNDIEHQRGRFISLSKNVYALIKVSKTGSPVYYQYCPMYKGGANWLSKESSVKNPYYGSKMMSCGRIEETIK
jgi:hypothetical protein